MFIRFSGRGAGCVFCCREDFILLDETCPFPIRVLGMTYLYPGIGEVQLMVGVRKRDKTKVQYCITAMTPVLKHTKKGSR